MSAQNDELKGNLVVCQTSQGLEIRAMLLRLTRHMAVFEVYGPTLVLRLSEVLEDFRIVLQERTVYSGRAVVQHLINTGIITVCEVSLDESAWRDVDFTVEMLRNGKLREQFQSFLREWQKEYRIKAEYKAIVADMQSYFLGLQRWLDEVELSMRSSPAEELLRLEQEVAGELAEPVIPCLNTLFRNFEPVAQRVDSELLPAHRSFMRRQLHPLVLGAPFAWRTFQKPLGYAGDYEMVNMIVRNQHEGASLFAKVVNTWFLQQPPAQAHRNRVRYLTDILTRESLRARRESRGARVFSIACGPAQEVQNFLRHPTTTGLGDQVHFTLLDFNEETLGHVRSALEEIQRQHSRRARIEYVRKSVQQVLKEATRPLAPQDLRYDLIYCAGLLDYLSDPVCQRLLGAMYDWLAPDGLLLVTNVEPANPARHGMEHLLDWHLVYRTAAQLRALLPEPVRGEDCCVRSDETGFNLFLEVRKIRHA